MNSKRFIPGAVSAAEVPLIVNELTEDILNNEIHWESYATGGLLDADQLAVVQAYDKKPESEQRKYIAENGDRFVSVLLDVMASFGVDLPIKYVLAWAAVLLQREPRTAARLFLHAGEGPDATGYPWAPLQRVLAKSSADWHLQRRAAELWCTLLASAGRDAPADELEAAFLWVSTRLRSHAADSARLGLLALRALLTAPEHRASFGDRGGLAQLAGLLTEHGRAAQVLYETCLCLWLATFSTSVAERADRPLVRALADVLRTQGKEKVVRTALATLVNLAVNGAADAEPAMVEAGLQKQLAQLQTKKWGDLEIEESLARLADLLQQNVADLSSFDLYKQEVLSGRLEWSPCHKNETFWRNNLDRFADENWKLVKVLKQLLDAQDPAVQEIACFDLGEFARLHPQGRKVLESTKTKGKLVALMTSSNAAVQKQALFSVQKLMISRFDLLD